VFDVDPLVLLAREVLRERTAPLVAEACAWSVGLSDRPHVVRRAGRLVRTGTTLGVRAETELPLGDEEDARPGSFRDALAALDEDGTPFADHLEHELVEPFVLDTCLAVADRARTDHPAAWAELLDDLGEDGTDLAAVVRAAEWETPLRVQAEQLVLAALGDQPLVEVEAEGLPLSLVRAAERATRAAAPGPAAGPAAGPSSEPGTGVPAELAGAVFVADAAVREAGLDLPVPPHQADRLLDVLRDAGVQLDEVAALLPHLPVRAATAAEVVATADAITRGG
jgi:hypothetical protein